MMRISVTAFLALFFALPGFLVLGGSASALAKDKAPTSADELFDALSALPGLSAKYREEKFLTVLVDPVVSEGKILFVPPSKLIRVTTKPIWSSLVVEENALSYRDASGPQKVPAAKGDPARAFVEVFVDVARGNRKALEKTFSIAFSREENGWTLTLTPKKKDFGIRKVVLGGSKMQVTKMTILDANGDRTELSFSGVNTAKKPSPKQIKSALRKPSRW